MADIESKANQIIGRQIGDEEFQTEIGFNPRDRAKKLITKAIVGWKGFENTNGKELKCSDFNKLEVMKEFDWFAEFIEECRTTLAEEAEGEQEDAVKN